MLYLTTDDEKCSEDMGNLSVYKCVSADGREEHGCAES